MSTHFARVLCLEADPTRQAVEAGKIVYIRRRNLCLFSVRSWLCDGAPSQYEIARAIASLEDVSVDTLRFIEMAVVFVDTASQVCRVEFRSQPRPGDSEPADKRLLLVEYEPERSERSILGGILRQITRGRSR